MPAPLIWRKVYFASCTSISTSMPGATRPATCTVERAGRFGCSLVPKNCEYAAMNAFEVHLAALGGIADQVHRHRDHVAEAEPQLVERLLDAREHATASGSSCRPSTPRVPASALGSSGAGVMPLWKMMVLPAGTSTARAIGNVLPPPSGWRTTSAACAPSRHGERERRGVQSV